MKVSIVIPVREINDYIHEAVEHYLKLNFQNFELIIFPDNDEITLDEKFKNSEKFKVISTGKIGPAQKRDLALKHAEGEIIAFIDDDAYPHRDWLSKAIQHFKSDEKIGIVGGPQLTPRNDGFWAKISGHVLANIWCSWKESRRYKVGLKQEIVDDLPSVNLIIRKKDFAEVDGFDSDFYPGEDSKLCRDVQVKLGKKIIYDPKVIVYHHRRPTLKKHLFQIYRYGLHRGNFMKRIPENSRKLSYLIPAIFLLFIVLSIFVSIFYTLYIPVFIGLLVIYFAILLITSWVQTMKFFEGMITALTIFLTHVVYGYGTINGLIRNKL